MPTLSKLIAAIAFLAVGNFAAEAYKSLLPEGTQYGQMVLISAVIGFFCGWLVMGRLVGKGYRPAMGSGVRTSITVAFWCLLVFCIVLMVRKAFLQRYDTPLEAVVDVFALMLEHGQLMLSVPVLSTLFIGGMLGGWVTEWAHRRWD